MNHFVIRKLNKLRLVGYLEGLSLIVLLFIAVPIKYLGENPMLVKTIGPVHGLLFTWFVITTVSVSMEERWGLKKTFKILLACMIPFGSFYIDKKLLPKES